MLVGDSAPIQPTPSPAVVLVKKSVRSMKPVVGLSLFLAPWIKMS